MIKIRILKFPRSFIFLLVFSLLFISAPFKISVAKVFTVSSVTEFQNALNEASTNGEDDVIYIKKGTYNLTSPIRFWSDENHSITLKGENGTIFDSNNSVKIMELITISDKGDIYIENITFQNGKDDYGGGLYIETEEAAISIDGCTVKNNVANFVGGGINIYSITGSIIIKNSYFITIHLQIHLVIPMAQQEGSLFRQRKREQGLSYLIAFLKKIQLKETEQELCSILLVVILLS